MKKVMVRSGPQREPVEARAGARERSDMGTHASRVRKRKRGATTAPETPLAIRTAGTSVDGKLRTYVAERLGRQLGKSALHVERVSVRFRDINGPRGGKDKLCRIKVVVSGLPSVITEERDKAKRAAFDLAAASCERTLRRQLGKARARLPQRRLPAAVASVRRDASFAVSEQERGSLIGRRVGRGPDNLERALDRPEKRRRDQPIDTAEVGVSATARKAGGGFTARRNTKRNMRGMTATLEDSLRDRPSRKSTRRSANRAKQGTGLERRQTAKVTSPRARARRASARRA